MKVVFDTKKIHSIKSSSKARQDVSQILEKNGYVLNYINELSSNSKLDFVKNINYCYKQLKDSLSKLDDKSTIIFQYPFDSLSYKFSQLIKKYARKKKIKTIVLIHDLNSLRTTSKVGKIYYSLLIKEIKFLNNFDYIIAHNKKMKDYLTSMGIADSKIIILGVFDYLVTLSTEKADNDYKTITIAGNLSKKKAEYTYKLSELNIKNYEYHLYGINYSGYETDKVKFNGSFDSTDLSKFDARGFGLVWDGSEYDCCSGGFGNYLRYNNPHKISLYLASGIPVIVWSKSALSSFVKDNRIGFAVDSLEELDDIFKVMKKREYNEYLKNVKNIQNKVTSGYFLEQALKKCRG